MIIDFHTHIFPRSLREEREKYLSLDATFVDLYTDPNTKMATAERLIRRMDEDGVDVSVAMGIGWTDIGLARDVNDYLIDAVRQYPERIVGFAGVSPAWGEAAAVEADRCARAGLRGRRCGNRADDGRSAGARADRDDPLVGAGRAPLRGEGQDVSVFPVAVHRGVPGGGNRVRPLGGRPAVLCLDAGSAARHDTAASPFLYSPEIWRIGSMLVGADHILMASDYPLTRVRRLRGQIDDSGIDETAKRAVMGGIAKRLLAFNGVLGK